MEPFTPFIIKSFKHNGQMHRLWLESWLVPNSLLFPEHAAESMCVLINNQTRIQEADGTEWISRVPGVAFFLPRQWFNVVALIESTGIRYYCNIASPPYVAGNVLTYIDYDLDVIRLPDGSVQIVDQEEYELHKAEYRYPAMVEAKVRQGMEALLARMDANEAPFDDECVLSYFARWKKQGNEV